MPVHDWNRVEAGIFYDFHTTWIGCLRTALNEGVLPEGFYALAEQHVGASVADVLTLHANPAAAETPPVPPIPGSTAVAEAPPKVRRKQIIEPVAASRRRTLAIRHVSGHRLIALVEIVSPANKDRVRHVEEFAAKAVAALEAGVHVLMIDLFPPTPRDPQGMHGIIRKHLDQSEETYDLPSDEPLTLAAYAAGQRIVIWLEHIAIGTALPNMPLFLHPDHYIDAPLEATYQAAYHGVPA